jgi:transcriptional regulator with XRE-family HTH domain
MTDTCGGKDDLATRLRNAREYVGYSQEYVSQQTGLNRSSISDIERGTRRVSSSELQQLASLYGYRVSALLGEEEAAELEGPATVLARQASELTPEDQQEVQRFIEYLRSRRHQ